MSAEILHPPTESYPELEELRALAERITSPESLELPDEELHLPKGIRREVREGVVIFGSDYSPTSYDRTVFHTDFAGDGPAVVSQSVRPTREDEGFGKSILAVTTFPLDSDKIPALTRVLGHFSRDPEAPLGPLKFVRESLLKDTYLSEEGSVATCRNLLDAARVLAGSPGESAAHSQPEQSLKTRLFGVLGNLSLRRRR